MPTKSQKKMAEAYAARQKEHQKETKKKEKQFNQQANQSWTKKLIPKWIKKNKTPSVIKARMYTRGDKMRDDKILEYRKNDPDCDKDPLKFQERVATEIAFTQIEEAVKMVDRQMQEPLDAPYRRQDPLIQDGTNFVRLLNPVSDISLSIAAPSRALVKRGDLF